MVVKRIGLSMNGLEPSGAIDMADRGNERAFLRANLENLHHERDVVVGLEPIRDKFAQDRGSKGAKGFATLDFGIEDVLHVGAARVAEDGAIAKGARAPFEAALEPANDFAFADGASRGSAKTGRIGKSADGTVGSFDLAEFLGQKIVRSITIWPPKSVLHAKSGLRRLDLARDDESSADGPARIAGGSGKIHLLERGAMIYPAVGDGIHGATAREGEVGALVLGVNGVQEGKEGFLVHGLDRAGDVLVFLFERFLLFAGGAEQFFEGWTVERTPVRRAIVPVVGDVFVVVAEEFEVEPECAVFLEDDDLTHGLEKPRFAVGSQAHHFVFIAVMRKPDELSQRRVKDTKRVRKVDAVIDFDVVAAAHPPSGAGEVAKAIDREADRFGERRNKERGGKMSEVVFDLMNLRANRLAGNGLLESGFNRGNLAAVAELVEDEGWRRAMAKDETEPSKIVDVRIAIDGDMIDSAETNPTFAEAILDGFTWESGPVFDAEETFLLHGGDQFSVLQKAGGGITVISVKAED